MKYGGQNIHLLSKHSKIQNKDHVELIRSEYQ